jgi:group I intron endonuclease
MVGIYKITSPSNSVYIGQSWNIEHRWNGYNSMKNIRGNEGKLPASFLKYGAKDHIFEVVHELPKDITQDILDRYEQLYIDCYRDCEINILNTREAGSRGKHAEETKEKLRNIKGALHFGWGKKRPEHSKKMIGDKNPRAKAIIQYDIDGNIIHEYSTAKEANMITNIPRSSICRSCKKNKFLQCGYKFNYKN